MKGKFRIYLILILLIGTLTDSGCSDNDGGSSSAIEGYSGRVLTSNDFAADSSLVARNEDLLVVALNPPSAADQIPKSSAGSSVSIPYYNDTTYTYSVCWEEGVGSAHYASLIDAYGNEVFSIHTGECIDRVVDKGNYVIKFYHDGTSASTTIFLEPIDTSTSDSSTVIDQKTSSDGVEMDPSQYEALIRTKSCPGCNLMDANLARMKLPDANLTNANLSHASMNGSDFQNANLTGANLFGSSLRETTLTGADATGANMNWADLNLADLSQATLAKAMLQGSNMTGATMTGTVLTQASLQAAVFSRANLSQANLNGARLSKTGFTGASLSSATWVDGRTCAEGSIGTCN